MNRITISTSDFKVETTSTWLASVLQFALDIDFFAPLQAFKLKMKKVRYSVYQKLTTILASIIMGCDSTKDINEVLGPEILAANMLGEVNSLIPCFIPISTRLSYRQQKLFTFTTVVKL